MPIPKLIPRPPRPRVKAARAAPLEPAADHPAAGSFALAPHNRRQSQGWVWATRIAVGLVLLLGLRALLSPLFGALAGSAPPPPVAEAVDAAQAGQLAVNFAADYWSYSSAAPAARDAALARWTARTGSTGIPAINGDGQLRADVVTAGTVVSTGPDVAVVQTTARVTPATLADGQAAPAATTTAPGEGPPVAADPGPAQSPWTAGQPRWLTLDVVVTRTGSGLHVANAALSGDAPQLLPRPTSEVDAAVTTDTAADLPTEVFTAIGSGALGYLTTPHTQLTGLSGAVELTGVSGWSVAADRADTGSRYATADVTWRLSGTGLTLTQPYALSITLSDDRWLLASVGPRIEE